jgi:hypothetical protein
VSRKIALVGDFKIEQVLGGAAFVDSYLVKELTRQGFDIDYLVVNANSTDWKTLTTGGYRGIVYSNLAGMTLSQLEWVCQSETPYILLRHDIPTIVYSFAEAHSSLRRVFVDLFKKARCTIFISDLQRQIYGRVISIGVNAIIPPPVSFAGFSRVTNRPRSGLLYLGPVCESRGLRRSIDWYKAGGRRDPFDIVGRVEDYGLAQYALSQGLKIFPEVGRESVPDLMLNYEGLVYHPNIIDSFCIKVIEAELCGLNLYVDRNRIGRFSYPHDALSLSKYMEVRSAIRFGKIMDAFF